MGVDSTAEDDPTALDLSVVVPVYNEADSVDELYQEITEACTRQGRSYEIVFVDDGSDDGSAERLDALAHTDDHVRVYHLRKNFGKSPALSAGFERTRGAVVLTLDADLQDDPSMIGDFVRRIEAGADLVSGWKKKRYDPIGKRISSRLFNTAVRWIGGVELHDVNCGFKAYTSECIRELRIYGGFHRFLPILAHARGFHVEELVVNHRRRKHGKSKYGPGRLFDGLFDLLTVLLVTRYRTRPLHFFGLPGALFGLAGLGILAYLTVIWFGGEGIGTRPLLMLGVLLTLTATLFVCIGLLGELLVRTTITPREVFSIRERPRPARARVAVREAPKAEPVAPIAQESSSRVP